MAQRHVAFLRAINVGKRRVEMARLRSELADAGLDEVSTHIASGNVIFESRRKQASLEPLIEARISDAFGWESEAFVRTVDQVIDLAGLTPFGTIEPGTTHMVAFLRSKPSAAERAAIEALSGDQDELKVLGSEIHWHIAGKSLDSALKPKDWKASPAALNTTRNMTMLVKLAAKLDA